MRAHSGTGAGWALPRGGGAGTGATRDRRCGRRQHEMRCGTVWALRRRVAAFLQKGLAKNLQAPLRRGQPSRAAKNFGANHVTPQNPGTCRQRKTVIYGPCVAKALAGMLSGLGRGDDITERPPAEQAGKARPPPPRDARGGTDTGTAAQRAGQQRLHNAKEGAERMQVKVQKQAANRRNKRGMICRHVRPPQIQTVYCMLPFRYFPGKTKAAPARIPGWGPLFLFTFVFRRNACIFTASPAASGILTGIASLPAPLLTAAVDPPRFL